MQTRLFALLPCLVAACQILAVCATLLGSLAYQFGLGELPCPLCVVQRLCFLLSFAGPLGILRKTSLSGGSIAIQARGFALCIFASLAGAATSIRQILLHIMPGDPGYGPPVLGEHLYTWALVVFLCLILGSAVGLLGVSDRAEPLPRLVTNGLCFLVLALGTVIALSTFAMEGFHFLLPVDPEHYELFRQLGLMK